MSFSVEIKKELFEIKNKRPCCRSSFLLGMIIDSNLIDERTIETRITGKEAYEMLITCLDSFKIEKQISVEEKLGIEIYIVRFESEHFLRLLNQIDNEAGDINSKCKDENCVRCFLRGAFIVHGTVSEPQKGYHLEYRLKSATRAAFVYRQLIGQGIEPKIVNRRSGAGVGLYYKNSSALEDVLTYLGAVKCVFDLINVKIEREIRNSVNRGTNCVAGNIAKSVSAAQRQTMAISFLDDAGKLSMLPDELFETAKLRLENPSMSLTELARSHEPPISKSGLNHRLSKIIEMAENIKNDEKE